MDTYLLLYKARIVPMVHKNDKDYVNALYWAWLGGSQALKDQIETATAI